MRVGPFAFRYQGNGAIHCQYHCWYHSKGNWLCYNFAAESFYFAADFSSCIVEIVQKSTNLCNYPHFEEVRGGIESWLMAHCKACVKFLLSVVGRPFLCLTVEALQGKMYQNWLPSGGGRSLWAKISGGRGHIRTWGIFLVSTKLDTFCYLAVQTAPCYVQSFWHNTCVWQRDRQTDRRNCRS